MGRRIALSLAFPMILALAGVVSAQDWVMPRTTDGNPDMQGIWSNASQTPLVRPAEFGEKGFLTPEEATAQMQQWRDRYNRLGQDIDPDRPPPTDGNANNCCVDKSSSERCCLFHDTPLEELIERKEEYPR